LVIIKKISFSEAICGFEFKLVHLDKRILIIRNKKGDIIKPDSIKQLKNEGMPSLEKPKKKERKWSFVYSIWSRVSKKNTYGNCRKIIKHITQKNNSWKKEGEDLEEVSLIDANFDNYDSGEQNRNEAYLSDEEKEKENGGGGGGCTTH